VKRLGPGLGAADDPGDGSSFGQHRSTLVAAALAESGAGRSASAGDWAAAALAVLRRDGYDPAALFLNPGAVDQFEPIDGGTPRAAE
jgi:hypothetical protein